MQIKKGCYFILFIVLLFVLQSKAQVILTDEVVEYKTVKIGTQNWMSVNLDVSYFQNGEEIPKARTKEEWVQAGIDGKPAWCYYGNNETTGKTFGKLYNWYAINDIRGICPKGFHIPTDIEWKQLVAFLGIDKAGTALKSTQGWDSDFETRYGSNSSCFSGYPLGSRDGYSGLYKGFNEYIKWWSACPENDGSLASVWVLNIESDQLLNAIDDKSSGLYIRCIKD